MGPASVSLAGFLLTPLLLGGVSHIEFIIVTGLSGAGKSEAVKAFEDMGFFCVDNLPPALIGKFVEMCIQAEPKISRIALVVDARGGEFFRTIEGALNDLEKLSVKYKILFLDASDEAILRRFKETRRRHPLAVDGSIVEGIMKEREILGEVRERANYSIDTSSLASKELRNRLSELFGSDSVGGMFTVTVVSFGFKYGVPMDSDLVFDCRFLPNPYWVEALRDKNGLSSEVASYVMDWPVTSEFMERLTGFLEFVLPNYIEEGRSHLVIAIGCTGGKHRSVALGHKVEGFLRGLGYSVRVKHRDISSD